MDNQNRQPIPRFSFLYKGTAMPYLAIFTSFGMPVKNPLTGIPLGAYISNFFYNYDEEKENQASITFDVGDPGILDSEEIKEKNTLILQWGYIYPNGSSISCRPVPITIRDIDCKFDSTGVHVTLICIDSVSYLRTNPPIPPTSPEDKGGTMLDHMDKGFNRKIGIIIEKFINDINK